MKSSVVLVLLALGTLTSGPMHRTLAQGSLTPPPGPPAPSMRTLTQIEPRTPVSPATTPGVNGATFRITQPGSYYLTSNIVGEGNKVAILIASSDVSLDLCGFSLQGVPDATHGIEAVSNGVRVFNGTVRGFKSGVYLLDESSVEQVVTTSNVQVGIRVGLRGRVASCTAMATVNGAGISTQGSTVVNCTASGNSLAGFHCVGGTAVQCVASGNRDGFVVDGPQRLTECVASDNSRAGFTGGTAATFLQCTAYSNRENGFRPGRNSTVRECLAHNNTGSGIRIAADNCLAVGNHCYANTEKVGFVETGAGITVLAGNCRIEDNHLVQNGYGLRVYGDLGRDNLVIRNTARANTAGNFQIRTGNHVGQVLANPGDGFVQPSAWANIGF